MTAMKWMIGLAFALAVLVAVFFAWWGRDPSTRLVDASGGELTAGTQVAPRGEAADPLFGSVHELIAAKDHARAKEALLRILEESDRDGEACTLLCDVTRELEEVGEAVDYGLKAVELLPESAPAHLAYARALGLKLQKESRGISGMLGAIRGIRLFKAEAERVIELDPTDTFARMMLVFTNLAPAPIGNVDRAMEIAEEIVPHDPVLGKRLLARCHQRSGDIDRAIELCQEGISEFPDDGAFHVTMADIFVAEERFDEADAQYEATRTKGKDVSYYRSLYYQARWRIEEERDLERAIALLDEYIADEPDDEELPRVHSALWRKGRALQLLDRVPEARAAWEECLRRNPNNDRAQDSLAETAE